MFATSCLTLRITSLRSGLVCLCVCECEYTHLSARTSLYVGNREQRVVVHFCGCNEACMSVVCLVLCLQSVVRASLYHLRTSDTRYMPAACSL